MFKYIHINTSIPGINRSALATSFLGIAISSKVSTFIIMMVMIITKVMMMFKQFETRRVKKSVHYMHTYKIY
jgi:hypothetical protein